jgi:hypothetical protein
VNYPRTKLEVARRDLLEARQRAAGLQPGRQLALALADVFRAQAEYDRLLAEQPAPQFSGASSAGTRGDTRPMGTIVPKPATPGGLSTIVVTPAAPGDLTPIGVTTAARRGLLPVGNTTTTATTGGLLENSNIARPARRRARVASPGTLPSGLSAPRPDAPYRTQSPPAGKPVRTA